MTTLPEYLQDSLGVRIFLGICLLLFTSIMICLVIEKKRLKAGFTKDDQKIKTIVNIKRIWAGMLVGFIITVLVGVAQFIFRYGWFSVMQEIGVLSLGFIGAVVGALCCVIRWRVVLGGILRLLK